MSEAGKTLLQPRLYLLDIEGTVAPLSLTSEVLFPYARAHLEEFLRAAMAAFPTVLDEGSPFGEENMVMMDLLRLSRENRTESDPGAPRVELPTQPGLNPAKGESGYFARIDPESLLSSSLKYIYWLMDRDRKSTALKSLQGKIWKHGFENGDLKGVLFSDVPQAFARWSSQARVAIYSSGTVQAQKLLFGHTTHGDLTPLIVAHFDTRVGAKAESASYAAIAADLRVAPAEILFFSDAVRELDAAREAGCATRLVMRPGNPPIAQANGHTAVESFATL